MPDELKTALTDILARLERIEAALASPETLPEDGRYLTVKQAAALYNVSPWTLYDLKPVLVKIGRAVRVDPVKLRRYLNRRPL